MAAGKIIAVDTSGREPRYTVELADGTQRDGLTEAQIKAGAPKPPAKPPRPAAPEAGVGPYEVEAGCVTINELRAAKGLPRDERYGDMTLPEYVAANAEIYALAAKAKAGAALPGADPCVGDEVDMADAADPADDTIDVELTS